MDSKTWNDDLKYLRQIILKKDKIEDITMNILVHNGEQVLNTGNWKEKIKSVITDTGNALTKDQILEFSKILICWN